MPEQIVMGDFEAKLAAERMRLVRLCARLVGDWDVAEDLAQETLLEAWRMRESLRETAGMSPWLAAIARHICLRYGRQRQRALIRSASNLTVGRDTQEFLEELPAIDGEPTIALERGELASLVEKALALLPPDVRHALLARYIHDQPLAEVAARLGVTEGTARVRLHRGKAAVRQLLTSQLSEDAEAMGIVAADTSEEPTWNNTRIWCPFCGRHRLLFGVDRGMGTFGFRCAGACLPHQGLVGSGQKSDMLAGLVSPKSILTRLCLHLSVEYRQIMRFGSGRCPSCREPIIVKKWPAQLALSQETALSVPAAGYYSHGISLTCTGCGRWGGASGWHLTLDTPAAIRFWRLHPRIRALPIRELEFEGRPALWSGFENCDGQARLDVISAQDTYEVLRVEGGSVL